MSTSRQLHDLAIMERQKGNFVKAYDHLLELIMNPHDGDARMIHYFNVWDEIGSVAFYVGRREHGITAFENLIKYAESGIPETLIGIRDNADRLLNNLRYYDRRDIHVKFTNISDTLKKQMKEVDDSVDIFTEIYETKRWSSGSGFGSLPCNTVEYRAFLERFMVDNEIKTILDIGCGDWQSSALIDWVARHYTGIDCVQSIIDTNIEKYSADNIRFIFCDIFTDLDRLEPMHDLIILKDVLMHWPNERILSMLPQLAKRSRFILVANDNNQRIDDPDIKIGKYRPLSHKLSPLNKFKFEFIMSFHENSKDLLLLRN